MTDLELDRAVEQAAAKEWEEQNAPEVGKWLRQAGWKLEQAVLNLGLVLSDVHQAAMILNDTPEGDRVASYVDEIENVLTDLKTLQNDFERRGN